MTPRRRRGRARARLTSRRWRPKRSLRSRRRFTFYRNPTAALLLALIGLGLVMLAGLASRREPPPQADDICGIFEERPRWFRAAHGAARRWDISEPIQLAILQQESGLDAWARPPRRRWWIFPGPRPSTAFGFAQALDATWEEYQRAAGNPNARRDDFADAVDFVGWHLHRLHLELGLDNNDSRSLYLAYHEGARGYRERRYATKPEAKRAAAQVAASARSYAEQYEDCAMHLRRRQLLHLGLRVLAIVAVGTLLIYATYHQYDRTRRATKRGTSR